MYPNRSIVSIHDFVIIIKIFLFIVKYFFMERYETYISLLLNAAIIASRNRALIFIVLRVRTVRKNFQRVYRNLINQTTEPTNVYGEAEGQFELVSRRSR